MPRYFDLESILSEADNYIDANDANMINAGGGDPNAPLPADPNLAQGAPSQNPEGGTEFTDVPNTDPNAPQDPGNAPDLFGGAGDDPNAPGGDDPFSSDPNSPEGENEESDNELKTPQSDSIKKVKLFEYYEDLYTTAKDLNSSLEVIPMINEREYADSLDRCKEEMDRLIKDLEYVIKYQFAGTNYITNRKNFLVFKSKLLIIGRIIQTLFIYNKSREMETLKSIRSLTKKLNMNDRLTRLKNIYNGKKFNQDYN